MLAPLNRLQINTLLYHFPQWTQLPQKRYPFTDGFEYIVNFSFRGESSNAKSDTRVRIFIIVA